MKKSWKTTTAGIGTILGAIGYALAAQFDTDPSTLPNWGGVIAAITSGVGLILARDNDKSSEQVGAR